MGLYIITYLFEKRYAQLNSDAYSAKELIKGMMGWQLFEKLRYVKVPSAIIVGDDDPTLPYCQEQHKYSPQAEYHFIKKSGHFSNIDQAEHFNEVLFDFLRRHS